MPKPALPFLHRYQDGRRVRFYVKLGPGPGRGIRVKGQYRSDEFMENYHTIVRGIPIKAPISKDGKGSLGWLIKQYRNSRDWCEVLSAGTRKSAAASFRRRRPRTVTFPTPRLSERISKKA